MIDESDATQLMTFERMLVWVEKLNCPTELKCLKINIGYHERMLEEQLNEFIDKTERRLI